MKVVFYNLLFENKFIAFTNLKLDNQRFCIKHSLDGDRYLHLKWLFQVISFRIFTTISFASCGLFPAQYLSTSFCNHQIRPLLSNPGGVALVWPGSLFCCSSYWKHPEICLYNSLCVGHALASTYSITPELLAVLLPAWKRSALTYVSSVIRYLINSVFQHFAKMFKFWMK